ncbi:MAG: T9SS type A sorting domain-containing protein, partial [Bacteroidetes bacterium]|nr:T9SS type A sorting domain-containing protein [Bacteroidota bacterium]
SFIITVDFKSGLGVDDDFTSDLMLIYPNPSDGIFSIELSEALESEVMLEVLDPLGKVLLQQEFPPYTLIQEEYNLSDRPAGIYFIRVYNASFQNLKKLMLR